MKKVSSKKYFEYFDEFVFNNNSTMKYNCPSKNEVITEHFDSSGKLMCRRVEKRYADKKGYHQHKEYFIAE